MSITRAGSSLRAPGSRPRRRTCPTPRVKSRFAGISRNVSAPMWLASSSQCRSSEKPTGVLSVVQRRYVAPGVAGSALRITTWPENGSCWKR